MMNAMQMSDYKKLVEDIDKVESDKKSMFSSKKSSIQHYIEILMDYKYSVSDKDKKEDVSLKDHETIKLDVMGEEYDLKIPGYFNRNRDHIEVQEYKKDEIEFTLYTLGRINKGNFCVPVAFLFDREFRSEFCQKLTEKMKSYNREKQRRKDLVSQVEKEKKYKEYLKMKMEFEGASDYPPGAISGETTEKTSLAIKCFKSNLRIAKIDRELKGKRDSYQVDLEHFIFLHMLKGTDFRKSVKSTESERVKETLLELKRDSQSVLSGMKESRFQRNKVDDTQKVFDVLSREEIAGVIKKALNKLDF